MKELSTEEKAKRYDEAIERAKKWRNAPNIDKMPTYGNQIIEELFPELKESEDERIRRVLIELVKCNERSGYKLLNNVPTSSMIAWLEKQGEQKHLEYPYISGWRENRLDNKPRIKHSVLMFTTHGVAEGEWLGEEWRQYRWSCKVKDADVLYWLHLSDLESLEKEGKQKSADKVEPKFKVGDWITNGEYTWKIVEVNPLDYILQSQDGNIVDDTISYVDEYFHLKHRKESKV